MNKELIIDSNPSTSEVAIALMEDKRLVELSRDKGNNQFAVGDLYVGRVKKIISGLNAAFVDVGYEKDGFLHYLDLGPQVKSLMKFSRMAMQGEKQRVDPLFRNLKFEKDIEKTGKINQVLNQGQQVLVQIAKEPISAKGPRITSELSLAGRFLVLVPFSERISISQKIRDPEERKRLKRLIMSIRPKNFGVIIRTVAEHKKVAELDADLRSLVKKWESAIKNLANAKAPLKVMGEMSRTSAILRDLLNDSFNSISVNDKLLYEETREYIEMIAPDKLDIVKLYKGKTPIFEKFGVETQIKQSFGKKVPAKNGAYLIIEHTEAMHVIDVNSGHRHNAAENQEQNALEVNLAATEEIARQLRLRDMGGIIVIDYIDMHDRNNRRKLYEKVRDEMKNDNAKHTILPPSKFGLVQITRQRVRPEMEEQITEQCPACGGSGEIRPSVLLVEEIENNLQYLLQEQNEDKITVSVHPFVFAHLTKGFFSIFKKWKKNFKKNIKIKSASNHHFLEYHFYDRNEEELKM